MATVMRQQLNTVAGQRTRRLLPSALALAAACLLQACSSGKDSSQSNSLERTAQVTSVSQTNISEGQTQTAAARFSSDFANTPDRVWIGQQYYSNRLQDWRIRSGRLESVEARAEKPMRTTHLLTHNLGEETGNLLMSVRTGPINKGGKANENTWSGFLIGAGGKEVDYRISALTHHWPGEDGGLIVGIDGTGKIIVRDNSGRHYKGSEGHYTLEDWPLIEPVSEQVLGTVGDDVTLRVSARPDGQSYQLEVSALDSVSKELVASARYEAIAAHQLSGNVALVSHLRKADSGGGYWFNDWQISGSKLRAHPDRAFGPVLGTQYTLSRGVLKLTAQMGPLGSDDTQTARLQVLAGQQWRTVASGRFEADSATIAFRVENWQADSDTPFRVAYQLRVGDGNTKAHYYEGTIRRPPTDREEFVLGVLNCNNISSGVDMQWNHSSLWHPHADLLESMQYHKPDMMFFAGDQIYEKGLAGIERTPVETANLDYLYHWYRFLWAFGDLSREMPSVAIPDDHDVYHGNIWGEGGKKAEGPYKLQHDNGGYIMDPRFVNMVHRTQTSHLPDPVDPTPIKQDISVYYTDLSYAGISFAIIADRMWKSAPRPLLPEAKIWNGWVENPDFDLVNDTDVPSATLLGDRQLRFLDQWSGDWGNDTWMKVLLSATPFTNVATLPKHATNDSVVPELVYPEPGSYVKGDKSVADMDSNGWPQTGRRKALETIRRGYAFHVVGDQHLSSFVQYGIDEWDDAGYAFVSPAIANYWPRRWFPPVPGNNRKPGSPEYTGEHLDGFGNRLTVHAVANPVKSGKEPAALYDRSPGYGIVRFNRKERTITAESWPRWVDPAASDAEQYFGWPVTVKQEDNYGRRAAGHLPTIVVSGMADPVVQVINETTKQVEYTLRIKGDRFQPKIFDKTASYTVRVGNPDTDQIQQFNAIKAVTNAQDELKANF